MNMEMAMICLATLGLIILKIARDIFTRRDDVLSWTNLFLFGYAHFVCLSGFFVGAWETGVLRIGAITDRSTMWYAILCPTFLILFLLASSFARRRKGLSGLFPKLNLPITMPGILATITVMLVVGIIASLAPPNNVLGLFIVQLRGGLGGAATGLAIYYFLATRYNPLAWVVLIGTLGIAVLISFSGTSGRRDLVSVLLAAPIMWYFVSLRYQSGPSIIRKVGPLVAVGILGVAFLTTIRHKGVEKNSTPDAIDRFNQIVELATNPRISTQGVEDMIYTDTAGNTMWIIDRYPETYAYEPLAMAYWIIVNPIPRAIFPGKPEALGVIISDQMGRNENLGAGIIGHAWREGGPVAVMVFAIAFGLIYGTGDRALRDRAWNPYAVAAIGSGAGNVFAMSRGDTGLFFIQVAASVIGVALVMSVCKSALSGWASAFPPLLMPNVGAAAEADDDQDATAPADYGTQGPHAEADDRAA